VKTFEVIKGVKNADINGFIQHKSNIVGFVYLSGFDHDLAEMLTRLHIFVSGDGFIEREDLVDGRHNPV